VDILSENFINFLVSEGIIEYFPLVAICLNSVEQEHLDGRTEHFVVS
jgi:hypothetical protein